MRLGAEAPSLVSNVSWAFIGNVIYAFSQWGILVSITKVGTTAGAGQFALGLAVTAPAFMLLNFQLRSIQATDANDRYSFGQYWGLRFYSCLLAFLLIAAFVVFSSYSSHQKLIILILAAAKAVESISDVCYGLLQKNEMMQQISSSLICRGVASLCTIPAVLLITRSLIPALAVQCLVWLGVLLLYDLRNVKKIGRFRPVYKIKLLKSLLYEGVPMGVTSLLISLNTNIPRYFIEHYKGTFGLGVFIAVESMLAVPQTLVDAVAQSLMPGMARHYAGGEKDRLVKTIKKLLAAGVILGTTEVVLAGLLGKPVLVLMYNSDIAAYSYLLVSFMILSGILHLQTFLFAAVNSVRLYKVQMPVNICKIIVVLTVSVLMIQKFGMAGALAALIISALFSVVIYALLLSRTIRKASEEG